MKSNLMTAYKGNVFLPCKISETKILKNNRNEFEWKIKKIEIDV